MRDEDWMGQGWGVGGSVVVLRSYVSPLPEAHEHFKKRIEGRSPSTPVRGSTVQVRVLDCGNRRLMVKRMTFVKTNTADIDAQRPRLRMSGILRERSCAFCTLCDPRTARPGRAHLGMTLEPLLDRADCFLGYIELSHV